MFGIKRARHRYFLFPVPNCLTDFFTFLRTSPPFFSRVLPASRLIFRARIFAFIRASVVARWAPTFGMCDEHCIGGDGDYCGDSNAQLGRVNVFNHET